MRVLNQSLTNIVSFIIDQSFSEKMLKYWIIFYINSIKLVTILGQTCQKS